MGAPLFQAGAEESAGSLTQPVCSVPACGVELIDHNHAVGHSAYHMLYTPELIPTAESCPICLGPSADCPVYLLKTGSSALQPRVLCKVLLYTGGIARRSEHWREVYTRRNVNKHRSHAFNKRSNRVSAL